MKNIIVIVFIFITLAVNAQKKTEKLWTYPIISGSKEWKEMPYMDKVHKSQLPNELLKTISTSELFDYCIKYPFNFDMLLFNDPDIGFKRVYDHSNVWQEFIQRKDAFTVLVNNYTKLSCSQMKDLPNGDDRTDIFFNLFFLEKIISETGFSGNLKNEDKKKLVSVIYTKFQEKNNFPNCF